MSGYTASRKSQDKSLLHHLHTLGDSTTTYAVEIAYRVIAGGVETATAPQVEIVDVHLVSMTLALPRGGDVVIRRQELSVYALAHLEGGLQQIIEDDDALLEQLELYQPGDRDEDDTREEAA